MKKFSLLLLLQFVCINIYAALPEYNAESKRLTIPVIKYLGIYLYNAVLIADEEGKFTVSSYSIYAENPEDQLCTPGNINKDIADSIAIGMSLEAINTLVGCSGESTYDVVREDGTTIQIYKWYAERQGQINVTFRAGLSTKVSYLDFS